MLERKGLVEPKRETHVHAYFQIPSENFWKNQNSDLFGLFIS
jgi:hypothetical protein